ncbi:MAG: excinuclease ABC subunit UvrB [Peptostreptococcales bacterium]
MGEFKVKSDFQLTGDQPFAVNRLAQGVLGGKENQVLLGVTGSGKTFTIANVIERLQRPTLVISHNKTLAAQLYGEFKEFFPESAVEFFVSYYDYYQPEAYIAHTDTYIEKDSQINEEIEKLRHSATASLFERRDVIIVASVSCIYGLGSPIDYENQVLSLRPGMVKNREEMIRKLVEIQYMRNDINFIRSTFRVRGDVMDIYPAGGENAIRVEFFGDEIESLKEMNSLTGEIIGKRNHVSIFPASHYVTTEENMERAIRTIESELKERIAFFKSKGKLVEAQRIEQRTRYDIEMLRETGSCKGIENYSKHISGGASGTRPYTLLDYFPEDFLVIIDESHVMIPQLRAMYAGDQSRKSNLVEYGFRLPSALDNRPLNFVEFNEIVKQCIYVSATPADYEKEKSNLEIIEQIIRPTGLVDPAVEVRKTEGQIDDLIKEINEVTKRNERVFITTLTKKMAEQLTDYLRDMGIKVKYLHSEIETLDRIEIIRDLRLGEFDVLVGINLLREGLDIPEVSLIIILDADKEGFLRTETSLIQTIGRAARNVNGKVIMYGDQITGSMKRAIDETERRRKIQEEYNRKNKIEPQTIVKKVRDLIEATHVAEEEEKYYTATEIETYTDKEIEKLIKQLDNEMRFASQNLQFERAAVLRDQILEIKRRRKT